MTYLSVLEVREVLEHLGNALYQVNNLASHPDTGMLRQPIQETVRDLEASITKLQHVVAEEGYELSP